MKQSFLNKKNIIMLIATVILISIDQILKIIVESNMNQFDTIKVIPGFLQISYVQNNGAAFSIMSGLTWVLIALTTIILIALIGSIVSGKVKRTSVLIAFSLVIAGGVGNLIDRIFRGFVVDYIDVKFWPMENFAIFNLADCFVVVGAILAMFFILFNEFKKDKKIPYKK